MSEQIEEPRMSVLKRVFTRRNALIGLGLVAGLAVFAVFVFWTFWMHFVDKHELGYVFDRFTGEIEVVEHSGWVIRAPIHYDVNVVDLRPYQVSISVNVNVSKRILNAKLVRFNPDGLDTFIAWHGRGAGNTVDELKEILKCYAFDRLNGADCPFLTVVSELSPDQGTMVE